VFHSGCLFLMIIGCRVDLVEEGGERCIRMMAIGV
jgi:hypothetical protein